MKKTVFLLLLAAMFAPWATKAQMTLNLYEDETVICDGVPIYSTSFFYWTKTQTVFPAGDLQEMAGRTITEIKFYTAPVNIPFTINNVSCYIYLTEVNNSTISDFVARSSCTSFYIGGMSFQIVDGVGEVTITLGSGGYEYHGGDLLFGCENNVAGRSYNSPQVYYYGKNAPGAPIYGVSYSYLSSYGTVTISPVQRNFLPRTTFTYTGTPHSCPKPTNLAVNYTVNDATSTATATWDGSASSYDIEVNGSVTSNVSSPFTFNVTPETQYSVRVRANCGGDNSRWTEPKIFIPSSHTQIGWGTATDLNKSLPLNNSHNYSLTEQIYTPEELGNNAATFQTIDFYKVGTGACERNLDIYMVNSPTNSFNPSYSDQIHVRANRADLVYSGTVSFADDAWTSIELNTPFEYDGNHDIAIVVDDNTGTGADDVEFLTYFSAFPDQTTATPARGVYHYSDDINFNPDVWYINEYHTSFAWYNKNQIRILKGPAPACFKPINITVNEDDITATTAPLTWEDLNDATIWKVQYSTSSDFTSDVVELTVTGTPSVTLTNLIHGHTLYYVRVQSVCVPDDPNNPNDQLVASQWSFPISFYTALCDYEDMCSIYCELYDNGYGWNEAAINIYDDASDIFLYSLTCYGGGGDGWKSGNNLSTTDALPVCPSRPIRFEWDNGYNTSVEDFSYIFYDLNNAEVFSGTGDDIDNFTYTTDCVESICDRPSRPIVRISGTDAIVQWEESADGTYNIYLNGELYDDDVNSPYTIENLDLATTYKVKLESTCGSGASYWTRPVSFTTGLCLSGDQCQISYELNDEHGYAMSWGTVMVYDDATNSFLARWGGDGEWEEEYNDDEGDYYYYSTSGTLSVCDGRSIRFVWDGDNCLSCGWSFIIKDCNQEETVINLSDLYSGNATYYVDCLETSCRKPANFVVNYEGGTPATATRTMVDGISYNLSLNGSVINNVTSPYYLYNLDYATLYEVKLQADCGNEVSQWVKQSFVTDFCSQEEMCEISYELVDMCNDGWDGNAAINVVDDETDLILATLTVEYDESPLQGSLRVCNGRAIRFEWVAGSFDDECSYTVYDVNGEELFSGDGPMYEEVHYTPNCLSGIIDANGWYAISAPYYDEDGSGLSINVANVEGLIPTETGVEYDLFRYNESLAKWENQKMGTGTGPSAAGFTTLDCGRGYIYRRSANTIISFNGTPYAGPLNQVQNLATSCATDENLKGFNLIGNPYQQPIYKGVNFDYGISPSLVPGFYSLRSDGSWFAHTDDDAIAIGEGVLVKVSGNIPVQLSFDDESEEVGEGPIDDYKKGSAEMSLQFDVKGCGHEDVVYAMLNAQHSEGLPKVAHLNADLPSLSIPQGGIDYAIAMIDRSTQAFPLKFRAVGDGEYTVSVSGDVSETGYLHLIDRATGSDIDLLSQPTYTFTNTLNQSSTQRFVVKLSPNADEEGDGIFAYQKGDRIVVEGTGTLQVYDVLGRQLFTHEINSQCSILNSQFPSTGVYILRLNGKSQKLVIK